MTWAAAEVEASVEETVTVPLEERAAADGLGDLLDRFDSWGVRVGTLRRALDAGGVVEIYEAAARTLAALGDTARVAGPFDGLSAEVAAEQLVGMLPRDDARLLAVAYCEQKVRSGVSPGHAVDRGRVIGGVLVCRGDASLVADAGYDALRAVASGSPVPVAFDVARREVAAESVDGELRGGKLSTALEALDGPRAELFDNEAHLAFVASRGLSSSGAAVRARWAPQAAVKPLGRGCRVAAVVPRAALSPLLARSAGRPDPADFPEVVAAALGLWDTGQAGRLSSPVGAMCAARAVLATGPPR